MEKVGPSLNLTNLLNLLNGRGKPIREDGSEMLEEILAVGEA